MFMIIFDPILYYLVNEREMGEGICSRQLNLGWILSAEGEDGSKMEQCKLVFHRMARSNSAVGLSICEAA